MQLFCFILEPLFKNNMPKNKQLDELYSDDIEPLFGTEEEALAHVWFGLDAIGTRNPNSLLPLLHGINLFIAHPGVLLRKLLAKIALELCSKVDHSKKFIRSIVTTGELEGVSSVRDYMPPEERQNNHNAFIPYILKLFREAEDQLVIAEDDLSTLKRWLDDNNLRKLSTEVSNFNSEKPFHKECKYTVVPHLYGPSHTVPLIIRTSSNILDVHYKLLP